MSAFTLIEMLVVIAVIAILAGIIVAALPSISGKRVRSRVTAEMSALETVIQSYKEKKGFFPPGTNTLYYELTGQAITDPTVKTFLGLSADAQIVNSGAEDSFNFYKSIRPSQIVTTNLNNDPTKQATLLAVRTKAADGSDAAVWNYDSMSDTRHNHDSFDLWVDVLVNGRPQRIGNWRE